MQNSAHIFTNLPRRLDPTVCIKKKKKKLLQLEELIKYGYYVDAQISDL